MFLENVKKTIDEHEMILPGDKVVVGVSGGADSVCLFHVLRMLREDIGFSLSVVHIHHSIRGEEADRDAEFVRSLCEEADVPFTVRQYDVPAYAARNGLSVEESGRILRREAFAAEYEKIGGTKIALAHHMNDVAETVLFNMARGAGIAGLASLRPVRGQYIRPLLGVGRPEIEAWLEENGFSYCIDSTNADSAYSRNRIRNMILPELTDGVNRQSVRHIFELSEEAGAVEEWIEECADECLRKYVVSEREGEIILDKRLFAEERSFLAGRTVKTVVGRISGTVKDIGRVHIRAVCGLANMENGKRVSLPYGLCAESVYDKIRIGTADTAEQKACELVPGAENVFHFGGKRISAVLIDRRAADEDFGKTENVCTKKFDYDKINGILKIRYRMAGDYLVINPDGRRKSLSDYFTDTKIPRADRDKIPLIACGSEILWVIGLRSGESCRIDEKTGTILSVTAT